MSDDLKELCSACRRELLEEIHGIGLAPCDRCGESKCTHLMKIWDSPGDNLCLECAKDAPSWKS